MFRPFTGAVAALIFALSGCAGSQPKTSRSAAPEVTLAGGGNFDIASCRLRAKGAPKTRDSVTGALRATLPSFRECFAPASSRVEEPFDATIQAFLSQKRGGGVRYELVSTGLSDSGRACVLDTAKSLAIDAPSKLATPKAETPPLDETVQASVDFPFSPPGPPTPQGRDPKESAAVAIRLGEPLLCECYEPFMNDPAPEWEVEVTLHEDRGPAFQVFSTNRVLAACLTNLLPSIRLPPGTETFVYRPPLMNSLASTPNADSPPNLQYEQYLSILEQKSAEVSLAAGVRSEAADRMERAVHTLSTLPEGSDKQEKDYREQLVKLCSEVQIADKEWIDAIDRYKATGSLALIQVREFRARTTNAGTWNRAESAITDRLNSMEAKSKVAETTRLNDVRSCQQLN